MGLIGLLSIACLVTAGSYTVASRRAVIDDVRREADLHARVVESHLSRLLAAAANVADSLAADNRLQAPVLDTQLVSQLLTAQLAGQPSLRSLALVDQAGVVQASSFARDIGQTVDLSRLGLKPHESRARFMGPLIGARTLFDLAQGGRAGSAGLPMLQHLPGEPTRWLVTLINADYFSNEHALLMQNEGLRALVLQTDGTLVSSTQHGGPSPGAVLGSLPPFTGFLPNVEAGWYEGAASDGHAAVAVFRLARAWPLVVLVEHDLAEVQGQWARRLATIALLAAAMLALLLSLGWLAERGLRREQQVLDQATTLRGELYQAEQRWRLAVDAASHGVWEIDFEIERVRLSAGYMRILGHPQPPQETLLTFAEGAAMIGLDNHTEGMRQLRLLMSGQITAIAQEMRVVGVDGQYRWVLSRGTLAGKRSTDGRWTGLIGTATDITAQKSVQQQLLSSETRLNAVLESAIDGIVAVDDQQRVVLFNPAAARIFGWQQQAAIGQPLSSFMPQSYRANHRAFMDRLTTQGRRVASRLSVVTGLRQNGEEFPLETAFSHCNVEGVDYFTAIVRDLTEERRMQADLRASEGRLRALFEHAAVGMLEESVRGDPCVPANCRYLRCNGALCAMLGYQPDELLALRFDEIVHPDDIAPGGVGLRDLISGRITVYVTEQRMRRRDGRYLWVQAARSLIPGQDEHEQRFLLVIADISQRREAQMELDLARQRETAIGARIQQSLLVGPPDQRLPGVWLSTINQASQGADGDFVEVMQLGDDTVDVVVGDVMGKGLAAALLGAAVKMEIARCVAELLARHDGTQSLPGPAAIVCALHKTMAHDLLALDAFVTLSYLRLDTRHGRITWVGCGHEEPVLVRAGSMEIVRLPNQQPPLGVLMDCSFEEGELPLGPRDSVLLASDGASDALLPDGSRIGRDFVIERLLAHLAHLPTPAAVLHALKRDIEVCGAVFTDDLTLALAMGADASRREFFGGLDDLTHVRGLVGHRARLAGLDDDAADLFTIGTVEAYTNAVIHTCGRPHGAPVEMVVRHGAGHIVVDLVTLGDPFDAPAPIADIDYSTYPQGGFGTTIMHRTADRVDMRHQDGANIVTLERRAGARPGDRAPVETISDG